MVRFIFLLLPFVSIAQYVDKNEIDEFTGNRVIKVNCMTGKRWGTSDVITKGLLNYVYLTSNFVKPKDLAPQTFYFTLGIKSLSAGTCLSPNNGKAIWLFEDKSTLEVNQTSGADCNSGNLLAQYTITQEQIDKLSTGKLSKLRVYTSEGYVDYEIRDDKKEILRKTFETTKALSLK
jgi:hypothetical protein